MMPTNPPISTPTDATTSGNTDAKTPVPLDWAEAVATTSRAYQEQAKLIAAEHERARELVGAATMERAIITLTAMHADNGHGMCKACSEYMSYESEPAYWPCPTAVVLAEVGRS